MSSDDESICKELANWKKLRQENSQSAITKQSCNPLCDDKIKDCTLECGEWVRKHTSLSQWLYEFNENEKNIKSEISSISNSSSKASTVESSKSPSSSLSFKEINYDVNEYNSSTVQLIKWVQEVINESCEKMKSAGTSDMKMDMDAPITKKYSFDTHHNISKEMICF